LNVYLFVYNASLSLVDKLGLKGFFDCKTDTLHRHVSGGALAYFGVSYDEEITECKCCKEDGTIGQYYKRDAQAQGSASVGAGFSIDFGRYEWKWLVLHLQFDLAISGPGIDLGLALIHEENECDENEPAQDITTCIPWDLSTGISDIGIGNDHIGLFADLAATFDGRVCLTVHGGKNPNPRATFWGYVDMDGDFKIYGMWNRKEYYLINEPKQERLADWKVHL